MPSKVHFLNVGTGDCTIIEHPSGHLTMIDINNGDDLTDEEVGEIVSGRDDEVALRFAAAIAPVLNNGRKIDALKKLGINVQLTNPIEFLHAVYPGKSIFRYIQSHPDLDHMRGLSALLESDIPIHNFWDCPHDKEPEFRFSSDEEDWKAYLSLSDGSYGATVVKPRRGSQQKYYNVDESGNPGGDGLTILSPTESYHADCREAEDTNNSSYVLAYRHAGICVILGGDAERDAWEEIYKVYGDGVLPSCNVLKASHHGRDSGYHQKAVKAMSPQYTIISAGKKPDTEVANKYAQYCPEVWTTRWMGNIHLRIQDDGKATIHPDRDA